MRLAGRCAPRPNTILANIISANNRRCAEIVCDCAPPRPDATPLGSPLPLYVTFNGRYDGRERVAEFAYYDLGAVRALMISNDFINGQWCGGSPSLRTTTSARCAR